MEASGSERVESLTNWNVGSWGNKHKETGKHDSAAKKPTTQNNKYNKTFCLLHLSEKMNIRITITTQRGWCIQIIVPILRIAVS